LRFALINEQQIRAPSGCSRPPIPHPLTSLLWPTDYQSSPRLYALSVPGSWMVGLMSYGPSLRDGYSAAGRLHGPGSQKATRPSDMPVWQKPFRFELIIDLKGGKDNWPHRSPRPLLLARCAGRSDRMSVAKLSPFWHLGGHDLRGPAECPACWGECVAKPLRHAANEQSSNPTERVFLNRWLRVWACS